MPTAARPPQKATLSQILSRRLRQPIPSAVASWLQDHAFMPDSDMKRMKKLYDKVMNETITQTESVELDSLMEATAAMDVLRAHALLGNGSMKRRAA